MNQTKTVEFAYFQDDDGTYYVNRYLTTTLDKTLRRDTIADQLSEHEAMLLVASLSLVKDKLWEAA